jgi:hypothetical protein
MSFYKLISRTADAAKEKGAAPNQDRVVAKSQYTLLQPGLLTPDRKYYWHVRAQDAKGVWGPWSKTWSFTARGVGYPLNVTLEFDQAKGVGVLRWKANPIGRAPAKYRVYGSDEKGFTINDKRYQTSLGVSKDELPLWFPANFIAETTGAELAVIGADANSPEANKTYYRVVAVDAGGKRSGPSDYAIPPGPIIYSTPAAAARVGVEYRYQVCVNRSLGDLSSRMSDGQQVKGYFDIEKPKFALTRGPTWLKIDEATGVLTGTPDAPGKADVAVTATIDREVRKLDEAALKWGNEKVLSTTSERVGAAAQKFVIDVQPRKADAATTKKD